jgi:hypothetical protein
MGRILDYLKGIIFSKYLKSLVRNALQFGFGAIAGVLTVQLTKYNVPPETIKQLVDGLLAIREPLELAITVGLGSLLTTGLSLVNAKNSKIKEGK